MEVCYHMKVPATETERTRPPRHGEMSERLKEPVLKTGEAQVSVGSNPTLSAKFFTVCGSTQEAEGAPLLRE